MSKDWYPEYARDFENAFNSRIIAQFGDTEGEGDIDSKMTIETVYRDEKHFFYLSCQRRRYSSKVKFLKKTLKPQSLSLQKKMRYDVREEDE